MSTKMVAMILAGGKGTRLQALTRKIAKPAVSYGGKYRIIDFPLSNCANSGINDVGVLTQYESSVLNGYIGNGEKWGLNGVRSLTSVLTPKQTEEGSAWYLGTADAIYQNLDWLDRLDPEYVLILSGDHIYSCTYDDMLKKHIKNGADCTISVYEVPMAEASRFGILVTDEKDNITAFQEKPKNPTSNLASMGIYIFSYKVLRAELRADAKDPESEHDFGKNIIPNMFPYPSAQGLHVGHPEGYTATDIVARMKRMRGFNVLHPMGWDAFGLPAEQFAIKNNRHPEEFTRANIANFKNQIQSLGFSYDWSKELATIDPKYYKWTQWIFLQMYKHELAYVADVPVNYCPDLGTVLANEEVIDGKSERGGFPVIRMPMRQWILKITAYASRLEKDLDLLDWPKSTLEMQRNWIGESEGVEVTFKISGSKESFQVFTTRVDTLFGCTYCCLAPEHPFVKKYVSKGQLAEVEAYTKKAAAKSELLRTSLEKEKTGVYLGFDAINPINGQVIPVYVADYVLGSYGSGAVMAIPIRRVTGS